MFFSHLIFGFCIQQIDRRCKQCGYGLREDDCEVGVVVQQFKINNLQMSRNSIEKRSTLGEKGWLNRSRYNPESATFIPVSHNLPERFQRFQQSNVSIRNQPADESSLENRYEMLHKLYKGLITKTSLQNQNVNDQSKQIARLQKVHENNEKQIRRLRGMLGFLHKQNKETQTKPEDYSEPRSPKEKIEITGYPNIGKFPNNTSKDLSRTRMGMVLKSEQTQAYMRSPTHKSVPKPSNDRLSRSSKYLLNEPCVSDLHFKKEERCRSPGLKEKYKFIPSLPFA